jgi:hypothetical protein
VRKIDAFAHILPPSYAARLESIVSGGIVSDRILGYQQWIHEDPALVDLDARWRAIDPFDDYVQVLTLAVPPLDQLGEPAVSRDLARSVNDELAGLVARHRGARAARSRNVRDLRGQRQGRTEAAVKETRWLVPSLRTSALGRRSSPCPM